MIIFGLNFSRNDACVEGGESIFLDIFPIAEQMRQEYPEDFYTLTRVPATFQKIHYERYDTDDLWDNIQVSPVIKILEFN